MPLTPAVENMPPISWPGLPLPEEDELQGSVSFGGMKLALANGTAYVRQKLGISEKLTGLPDTAQNVARVATEQALDKFTYQTIVAAIEYEDRPGWFDRAKSSLSNTVSTTVGAVWKGRGSVASFLRGGLSWGLSTAVNRELDEAGDEAVYQYVRGPDLDMATYANKKAVGFLKNPFKLFDRVGATSKVGTELGGLFRLVGKP
jgi:hypothetical protein